MRFPTHLTLPERDRPPTRRATLLKTLDCPVSYIDGSEGCCRYERQGPTYHSFTFKRGEAGKSLAHLWCMDKIDNTPEAIGAKCQSLAETAFWRAVEEERKNWFARATVGAGRTRTVDPRTYRMDIRRAKALGGRYALCVRVGDALVPYSAIFDTLQQACTAWRDGKQHLAVGCCSRLDRNWQLPRLNPLVKEGHPRRQEETTTARPASGAMT